MQRRRYLQQSPPLSTALASLAAASPLHRRPGLPSLFDPTGKRPHGRLGLLDRSAGRGEDPGPPEDSHYPSCSDSGKDCVRHRFPLRALPDSSPAPSAEGRCLRSPRAPLSLPGARPGGESRWRERLPSTAPHPPHPSTAVKTPDYRHGSEETIGERVDSEGVRGDPENGHRGRAGRSLLATHPGSGRTSGSEARLVDSGAWNRVCRSVIGTPADGKS